MKVFGKILSVIMIAAILTGFVGVNLYHHTCSESGVHIVSLFGEQSCGHETVTSSCCSVEEENHSCCSTETPVKQIIEEPECCNSSTENIVIEETFVIPNISIPLFIAPLTVTFSDDTENCESVDAYQSLLDKALEAEIFRDNPIIRFIHRITRIKDPDASFLNL